MTEENTTGAPASDGVVASQPAEPNVQVTGTEPEEVVAAEPVAAVAEPELAPEPVADKSGEILQKAFNKIAFEKRDAERRAKEAEDRIADLLRKQAAPAPVPNADGSDPSEYVPRAELERLANERAERIATEKQTAAQAEASAKAFNDAADEVYAKGTKEFPDFENAVQNLRMLGHMNYQTVEAALATDNPQQVLYEMGKNAAEAERIMSLPPLKMAVEFAKLAAKAPAAPPKKDVSNAPAPVAPLEGTVRISDDLNDGDSDLEWGKKFEKKFYARNR